MHSHGIDTLHQKPSPVLSAGVRGLCLIERAIRAEDSDVKYTGHSTGDSECSTCNNKVLRLGGGQLSNPPHLALAKNNQ